MWCSPRLESAGGVVELPDHGGAEANQRQRTFGSSGGTAARGLEEGWGVQWRLREGAKELPWLRRGRAASACGPPWNGFRASRGFVAARPNRSSGWASRGI
jgi:hypothetical protein